MASSVLFATAAPDNDYVITFDQLPAVSRSFVTTHFPKIQVAYCMRDSHSFEVRPTDASEIEFNLNGAWKEVDCKYKGLPASVTALLPDAIPGLKPVLGFRAGGSYASDSKKWDEPLTMGASVAEAFYLKGAIVGGADYFFTDKFFLGITLNLFDYTYTVSRYKPQEDFAALSADGHLFGAIANPALRIGLRFGGK